MTESMRTPRQEHVSNILDELQRRGVLWWSIEFGQTSKGDGIALWTIADDDGDRRTWDTRSIEIWLSKACFELGIRWKPVPHPSRRDQYEDTLREIAAGTKPFPPIQRRMTKVVST